MDPGRERGTGFVMKVLFVGNLPLHTTEGELRSLFQGYGDVQAVRLINDRIGRSRGFGFVEMRDELEADRAIAAFDGSRLEGRMLRVTEAQPRDDCKADEVHKQR
jgi:RNA recognition motif-containing protein